ncbi:MAG TPA: hypothetical protein VK619_14215 [Pyrinomonadaceae bacterium]|nr:hypothetical protein [Pyrinomonadaceae bacterium]
MSGWLRESGSRTRKHGLTGRDFLNRIAYPAAAISGAFFAGRF